ncbi:unnamed protein product, partial [Polarella glacialis]
LLALLSEAMSCSVPSQPLPYLHVPHLMEPVVNVFGLMPDSQGLLLPQPMPPQQTGMPGPMVGYGGLSPTASAADLPKWPLPLAGPGSQPGQGSMWQQPAAGSQLAWHAVQNGPHGFGGMPVMFEPVSGMRATSPARSMSPVRAPSPVQQRHLSPGPQRPASPGQQAPHSGSFTYSQPTGMSSHMATTLSPVAPGSPCCRQMASPPLPTRSPPGSPPYPMPPHTFYAGPSTPVGGGSAAMPPRALSPGVSRAS